MARWSSETKSTDSVIISCPYETSHRLVPPSGEGGRGWNQAGIGWGEATHTSTCNPSEQVCNARDPGCLPYPLMIQVVGHCINFIKIWIDILKLRLYNSVEPELCYVG